MSSPIHPARAAMVLRMSEEQQTWNDGWLSQAEREALNPKGHMFGGQYALRTACRTVLNGLTPDQLTIAKLQAGILMATDELSHWLADHTEEVFEEEPEIDGARSILIDTFH